MAQDIGEQVMQKLLQALSRDGVTNSAKINYGLSLLARATGHGKSAPRSTARAARWCAPGHFRA